MNIEIPSDELKEAIRAYVRGKGHRIDEKAHIEFRVWDEEEPLAAKVVSVAIPLLERGKEEKDDDGTRSCDSER